MGLTAEGVVPAPGVDTQTGLTAPHLRECRGCGLFQLLPPMGPGAVARCARCNGTLRRTRKDPVMAPLACSLAGLVLFGVACTTTMMVLDGGGQKLEAGLLSGPADLRQDGMWELALVVLFTSVLAPFLKLAGMIYVLGGLRLPRAPRHLRRVFGWLERVRPWAMVEVYMLGIIVAYTKMVDMAQVQIGPALYALIGVMLAMAAADATLDADAVWEEMERRGFADDVELAGHVDPETAAARGALGCDCCGLVCIPETEHAHCRRCGAALEHRKERSLERSWAFLIAAIVMYGPANYFPVMHLISFGVDDPATILGGVEELIDSNMWPLAALVFFASITVPVLKVVCLMVLLISTQRGKRGRLRDKTTLYRIVDAVGRWSMIDVFMISILVALVRFGALITIEPGIGAMAFASVVILTMFAAEAFDPRLMWDNAAANESEQQAKVEPA